MREFAKGLYQSKQWRNIRKYVFKRDFGVCVRCNGDNGPGEIVHHKIHLTPYNISNPAISLNIDNLELVCRVCHALEHEGVKAIATNLQFDKDGNIYEVKNIHE